MSSNSLPVAPYSQQQFTSYRWSPIRQFEIQHSMGNNFAKLSQRTPTSKWVDTGQSSRLHSPHQGIPGNVPQNSSRNVFSVTPRLLAPPSTRSILPHQAFSHASEVATAHRDTQPMPLAHESLPRVPLSMGVNDGNLGHLSQVPVHMRSAQGLKFSPSELSEHQSIGRSLARRNLEQFQAAAGDGSQYRKGQVGSSIYTSEPSKQGYSNSLNHSNSFQAIPVLPRPSLE